MVSAALDACRMALVGTGWPICHLASTMWHRNRSFPLYGNHFWYCRQFSVRRSITHASKNDNSLKVVTIKILAFLSGCILAVLKVVCSHLKKILAVNIRRMQCSGSLIRKVYYMPA